MEKLFKIIFIYIFIIVINLNAQRWVNVNPVFNPPGNYNTYCGVFINKKNGWWLSGPNGNLWYTVNGGILWTELVDSIGGSDIEFIDTLHGWIVGKTSRDYIPYILITNNGGINWDKYSSPLLVCVTFFDYLNGFAGGDSIYKTTNGGINWEPQTVEPGQSFGITDIFFSDRKYGWAVGGSSTVWDAGIVLHTVDSGKTWKFNYPANLVGRAVYFKDSLQGCIVGLNPPFFDGVIKVTSDGGNNWLTHYYLPTWLNDVIFTDDSTGWVVGDYGFIWHTTDRGLNWTRIQSGTTSHLYQIFFFDNGKVGYILGSNGTMLKYDKTVSVKEEQPPPELSFKLSQNFPNPFNSKTQIEFHIAEAGLVTLTIYDILGKEVRILLNEEKPPGIYTVMWDGKDNCEKEMNSGSSARKLRFIK